MKKLPDIKTNFPDWYNQIIYDAQLADHAPVRGSIVIRPYGYALWENIKGVVDDKIKKTGHHNVAFPLLIPESFIKKEAKHIEGFAPELAIVTHAGGKKLEEPLVVRPTSETIIHYMFAKWIKSWRDLPIKINQWANVIRWELRPRPFLRTTEFFWQEGHTAHATKDEAETEVLTMLNEYLDLARNYLAIPVVTGLKSESEKFPGAEKTYTFEALMQDGKALQMGTSHLLSQSFAKAFDMQFQNQKGELAYPWLTSWGVSTRLIGAVVMVHGDQKGLILPPKIAPIQVVIIPIFKTGTDAQNKVLGTVSEVYEKLKVKGVRVHIDDDRHKTPGAKFYEWELKGVPIRLEIGPKDVEKNQVMMVDRLGGKKPVSLDVIIANVTHRLETFQDELFKRAQKNMQDSWHKGEKLSQFGPELEKTGGFYQTGWCQDPACELELKKYKASTRCLLDKAEFKACFHCGKPSKTDVIVARSY